MDCSLGGLTFIKYENKFNLFYYLHLKLWQYVQKDPTVWQTMTN